jgi:hypothetical protein
MRMRPGSHALLLSTPCILAVRLRWHQEYVSAPYHALSYAHLSSLSVFLFLCLQSLLKQAQDRAFEATDSLKSIRNDLADKEFALQTAQRKLAAARQQQQHQPQPQGLAAAGSMGGAPPVAAAAAVAEGGEEAANLIQELQAQIAQLQQMLEARTVEKDEQVEVAAKLQR